MGSAEVSLSISNHQPRHRTIRQSQGEERGLDTKNEIGGYSVVQAESHDAATKVFGKDHPHLQMPGAWIEIIEIMPLPGM